MYTWKQTLIFLLCQNSFTILLFAQCYRKQPLLFESPSAPFNPLYIKAGFFNFSIGIRGWTILCCVCMAGCLAASLASTHQIPVKLPPQVVTNKNSSRHWQVPSVENSWRIIFTIHILTMLKIPRFWGS